MLFLYYYYWSELFLMYYLFTYYLGFAIISHAFIFFVHVFFIWVVIFIFYYLLFWLLFELSDFMSYSQCWRRRKRKIRWRNLTMGLAFLCSGVEEEEGGCQCSQVSSGWIVCFLNRFLLNRCVKKKKTARDWMLVNVPCFTLEKYTHCKSERGIIIIKHK